MGRSRSATPSPTHLTPTPGGVKITTMTYTLLAIGFIAAADLPAFKASDFPPTTAKSKFTVEVGGKVTVGGFGADNFYPNEWMWVYVVPHRTWREGMPLASASVRRIRVRSDKNGTLYKTDLWTPDKAGRFDLIVDYDGDGRFSYSLDAVSAFTVRER